MKPSQSDEAVKQLLQHLPGQEDLVLIVLKGHLLVERQLYRVVRARAPEGLSVAEAARLRFWQLVRAVRHLVGPESPDQLWKALDALNDLRNELAHKLEPDDDTVKRLVETFLDKLSDFALPVIEGVPPSSKLEDRAKAGIAYLCGQLQQSF